MGVGGSLVECQLGVKMVFLCHVRSYLQVHQLELDSLGQQIRENKKNSRLVRACPVKPVTPVSVLFSIKRGYTAVIDGELHVECRDANN